MILAFGNSLTAGFGVPDAQSYPARLQNILIKNGYKYKVVNAGVSGDTTAGGVRRIKWLMKNNPEIVILELGANDGLRGLSLQEMESNLEKIILGNIYLPITALFDGALFLAGFSITLFITKLLLDSFFLTS